MSQYHTPVMVEEVLAGLQAAPGKRFIDATAGGGGHTRAIEKLGGTVLGIDTDPDATRVRGNFRDIESIAKEHGFSAVDGILFDLGVSSHQLDTPERGFSYRFEDAPLDLRMNQNEGMPAGELLQKISEQELYEILAAFGEEEHSRAIAALILRRRRVKPIATTGDLLHLIDKREAPQVFQALRIAVNDELNALKEGLRGAKNLISPGGRLVVISFHSLEDRIVKLFMKTDAWKLITKKPMVPSAREVYENKRARSAKLRIAEKL
ncbi:16S rRNA (cytosine(1402)-N(4))-methyltransferase [Candidatus Gottesmanbacteria bacterium RIFOXYB1_FULL_47_11]|uniref:Ribosomal RNA small subunit methyltransferase H n=1 Tax=Candidatus Gottesmanbacteria bacterium RIFOXYB1_FULL_47_11 TaxID=1798401 RepID=A0A1F6BC35_9BACT|nr:MAG: 16S rRNA (cytosine(1402)-N(4))-methyltransferase [Candidatus Gottesmanbacteria bacterium RIFOXYB1_FULL_47_11]